MQLPVNTFKDAVKLFEVGLIEREQNETNRIALAIGLRRKNDAIFETIDSKLAKDGLVDIDELRKDIDAGMDAGKGLIALPVKIPQAARDFLGVTLEKITVTKDYADYFFDNIIPSVSQSAIE